MWINRHGLVRSPSVLYLSGWPIRLTRAATIATRSSAPYCSPVGSLINQSQLAQRQIRSQSHFNQLFITGHYLDTAASLARPVIYKSIKNTNHLLNPLVRTRVRRVHLTRNHNTLRLATLDYSMIDYLTNTLTIVVPKYSTTWSILPAITFTICQVNWS